MNEYDFDSDQDLNDTVDLSEEEATAAAMLGLGSTKRLTKKQYADFKKKAQEIVSQASVPSKTAGKAAKGIVKGGGQKSAEVSARTFSKALEKGPIKVPSGSVISDLPQVSGKMGAALEKAKSAAAGVPWSPADGVINLSGPSRGSIMDALSRGGQSALSALKKIGVSPSALETAGKFLSKGARAAGPVAAMTGAAIDLADITSAGEGSDKPGKQLTSEEMAALYPGTPVDYTPVSSMRSDVEKQTSTPAYDVNTEGEIIKAALSQPQSPEYIQALQKRKQERERYVDLLKNDSNIVDAEKERLLAAYDANSPEQRANKDVDSLNENKTALEQKISEIEGTLASTSNPFSSDRLNKQLESYRKELAGLSSPQVDRMMAATPEPSANSILSQLEQGTQSQPKPSSPVAAPKPAQDGVMTKTATGTGQPTSAGIAKQDREDDLTKVIGAESARKVSEYEDLMRRFQEAQDRANQMRMMAGIGEGAELLGASIAGVKPTDASFYRQMAEQADLLPKQFKEAEDFKKETRRNDPSSEESESARNLLKSQGITVPDNISAAFIEKQYPQFANILARREAAKEREITRKERAEDRAFAREQLLSDKDTKDFTKLSEKLTAELASSRSAFGKGANIVRSAEAIETLVSQMNPKDINTRQIQELARGLDAMLSQGAATISGTKKLVPESYSADWAKIAEYITSKPKGAGQEAFVKQMMETVEREKETAKRQMRQTQNKILSGYEHLKERYPERYKRMLQEFGADAESPSVSAQKEKVVVEKDGKQYRLPKEQLDRALKQGYKEVK